jgi:two-component system nitrogen regulation sensor histidine kinase NtrY
LFATGLVSVFVQRNQHLIGGGINRTFLFLLINAHLIVSIILIYLIIRQSIKLAIERRKKIPGSAFKRNLFFAFIIFSVIPVVFVFFVAGKLISTSIDNWFQIRFDAGIKNSLKLHEHQTKSERLAIERLGNHVTKKLDIKNAKKSLKELERKNNKLKNYQIYLFSMGEDSGIGSISDEVRVWRKFRKINDRSTKTLRSNFFKILKTKGGASAGIFDFYGSLYWAKSIDNFILILVHRYPIEIRYPLIAIQNSLGDYLQLKSLGSPIYWNYFLTFLLATLLILFLSIWCAFYLARGISKPIKDLILATQKVKKGNLDVCVDFEPGEDLANLVIGFNDMTRSLQRAYKHLEFHNKEMLTMLEHIKESIFFINNYGRIVSFNEAAKRLIEEYFSISRFKNKRISFMGPYVKNLFLSLARELKENDKNYLSREVTFFYTTDGDFASSGSGETKTFRIYITFVKNALLSGKSGVLVVVEDLSEVYKINKIKTWQEAAKQMAHEVKNPLTPIQLATQRLQRKLRKREESDPALMECAETILQQVKIIKGLVSHFSEFAKMPDTIVEQIDMNKMIKEVGSLYEISYSEITFNYDLQNFLPLFKADKKKMKRVVVNLLDNSVRALSKEFRNNSTITVRTRFKTGRNQIELQVIDNGPGISRHVREKLFLPYVSSENKNMGLGLAIVHDIISQSGGSVKLLPSFQGATFQVLIPV